MVTRLLLMTGGATLLAGLALLPPALYSSPSGKYRIAMAGRSTMHQWFKSWNWPYLLHRYSIWRPWPIPFQRYAKGRYYFDVVPVPTPALSDDPDENGRNMFDAVAAQADPQRYDAVFFKFCYVDFQDGTLTPELRPARFKQMTSLVSNVHAMARQRGLRLLLGTALPVQQPAAESNALRREFSDWVRSYAEGHADTAVVDLYAPLVDEAGRLRPEYARASYDDHVGWWGFRRLDAELFAQLDRLFQNAPPTEGGR